MASSVCKSLQCLISDLTQRVGGGHLFGLTCSVVLWGRTLQTNITGMCGECSQCLGHTGFAPTQGMCAFSVYTAQALGCSAGELSTVGPGLHALPRSKPLGFRFSGTSQRHSWLGLHFVPFPALSSSGDEVFGACGHCDLSPFPSLPLGFLGVQLAHLLRWMMTAQNPKKS